MGLDGPVSYQTPCPYTVPYGAMVPAGPMTNVFAPVPVGGMHIGFSTLRMEPCWMALGQAAGVAASILVSSAHPNSRHQLLHTYAVHTNIYLWERPSTSASPQP